MNKTVKDFSVLELKALAYDCIAEAERVQANLRAINQELELRNKPVVGGSSAEAPVAEPVAEEVK